MIIDEFRAESPCVWFLTEFSLSGFSCRLDLVPPGVPQVASAFLRKKIPSLVPASALSAEPQGLSLTEPFTVRSVASLWKPRGCIGDLGA